MTTTDTAAPAWIDEALITWGRTWGMPDLAATCTVRFSTRMTRSFGKAVAVTGQITVAARLLDGDHALLREVLCHEAAHIATFRRYGRRVAAHGPQWRALMRSAGYVPRVTLPADPRSAPYRPRPRRYLHECPACGARRTAARTMSRWRCGRCRAAGRRGRLRITRLDVGEPAGRVS
ncbi:MAG TPA: SprT-like domain-containing protein [Euzebyales bacterium]|nr:SprT-like domain-containing protein [Euzebyales bacterium]